MMTKTLQFMCTEIIHFWDKIAVKFKHLSLNIALCEERMKWDGTGHFITILESVHRILRVILLLEYERHGNRNWFDRTEIQ